CCPLLRCPGGAAQDQIYHAALFFGADAVQTEVCERGYQLCLWRLSALWSKPIAARDELHVQVEHPLRSRPTKRKVAANFGDCVVGNEQGVGAGRIWRHGAELIMPQPDRRPAFQQVRDAAHNLLDLLARRGDELEVYQHHLTIWL